tara:strand:+ start:162 stop:461 length:300 start_codon:yes stop_codon:yes gene_type:complete
VEIKTKKHFNEIIKSLTEEILDEEDLDEMTATGNVAGYMTPMAFTGGKKKKKKSKKNSYQKKIDEALEASDMKVLQTLIRKVVADILRDIWLKRNAWKN